MRSDNTSDLLLPHIQVIFKTSANVAVGWVVVFPVKSF